MYSTESSDAPVGTSAPLPETRAEAVAVAQKPQKYRLSKGLWGFLGAAIVGVILQLTSKNHLWSSLDQWRGIGPPDTCSCLIPFLTGVVSDCCCEYETVDALNRDVLNPVLTSLSQQPFFRYCKVQLWCDCPFWPDDGLCHLRDCSVCECPPEEVPPALRLTGGGRLSEENPQCQEGRPHATVDRTLEREVFHSWVETVNPWTGDNEEDGGEMSYVNLLLNPERYTGYKGESARRIWQAIYRELGDKDGCNDTCTERRVFYRLISGLHTSINVHICTNYLLNEEKDEWGVDLDLFDERIATHPQRLENLYFLFLFVLRAATKAAPYLTAVHYSTGNAAEDAHTLSLVRQLLLSERVQAACPLPFDEARLWRGEQGPQLRRELQGHFRNISSLMDCVGCEKCRLWGKLQILGLGTALKILFAVEEDGRGPEQLNLQRNEVNALINFLARLSESLKNASETMAVLREKGRSGDDSERKAVDSKDGLGSISGKSNKRFDDLLSQIIPP